MTGSLRGVDKDRQLDSSGNENPIAVCRKGIEMDRVILYVGGGRVGEGIYLIKQNL